MNLDDVEVWIVDSSALIEAKTIVSVSNQWDAFKYLEQMVVDGLIALPRQVIREVSEIAHPDLPGAWAPGVRGLLQHPLDTGFDYLRRVTSVVPDVVDVNKPTEDADPWVLALALLLEDEGHTVCVVTKDYVDRTSISVATACDTLGIDWCPIRLFLHHCGIPLLKGKGDET
ncbi:MAG: DUF4411 family protein [bacterium]|nr:DUF4411 family protein [bacterium]MDE0600605.1 DUF4411 family protein [bacterium]